MKTSKKKSKKNWDFNNPIHVMQHFNETHNLVKKGIYDKLHKRHLAYRDDYRNGSHCYLVSQEVPLCDIMFRKAHNRNRQLSDKHIALMDKASEVLASKQDEPLRDKIAGEVYANIQEIVNNANLFMGARLFAAWRNTLSIYQIDEAVAEQAANAEINPETPSDIFLNLPEWAIYMKLPKPVDYEVDKRNNDIVTALPDNANVHDRQIIGFWATHDQIAHQNEQTGKVSIIDYLEIVYHLNSFEGIKQSEQPFVTTRMPINPNLTIQESIDHWNDSIEGIADITPLPNILSLLLWVCVEEPDVTNVKDIPVTRNDLRKSRLIKSKLSGSFVAPIDANHLTIAKRMGAEIREWNGKIEQAKNQGLPKRKIPHIRRGHWTGVWIGSGENKTYKTYWQKPIFVNSGYKPN